MVALRRIEPGEVVLVLEGTATTTPSPGSIQLDEGAHLVVPAGWDLARTLRDAPWRFLDHACEPSAWVRGRELVALRAIAAGEPVTFDYETTEWELAAPFPCRCGGAGCRGALVRGFVHLAPRERLRRLPQLSPHLRRRMDESSGELR